MQEKRNNITKEFIMAKANLKIIIDMNIDLPDGDTEITEKEKCAIIDRIHGYLTNIGTTSEDYDGCLAGTITPLGSEFELVVTEYPQTPEVAVYVSGGVVQGARGNVPVAVDVFDVDNKEDMSDDEIQAEWKVIETKLPIPVL
jgi:hypothetical protein